MSWSQLPPAGGRIDVSRDANSPEFLVESFGTAQVHPVNSGTAALATALLAARALMPNIDKPKVLMPAYGCPDLVSAADFAGVQPVLIDFEPDRPWMSLRALKSMLDENVIAVLAVALFGIRERLHEIAELLNNYPAILIEDNAQFFPSSPDASNWVGDALIFSLGRGKPASVLGGGLIVSRAGHVKSVVQRILGQKPTRHFSEPRFVAKAITYNFLRQPILYGLVRRLPFLALGVTAYKPLQQIAKYNQLFTQHATRNLRMRHSANQTQTVICLRYWMQSLFDDGTLTDLANECRIEDQNSLIRFPLLARDRGTRDVVLKILERNGLGVSTMYGCTLPQISGLEERFQLGVDYPAAENFSSRLLTLPTGRTVAKSVLKRVVAALHQAIHA